MATIKLELYTHKTLSDQRHPIMIRVTKDGKRSRLAVGSASQDEWDDIKKAIKPKGRKTHVADNIFIEDQFYKYKLKFNELNKGKNWSVDDFFEDAKEEKPVTFQEFAKDYIDSLDPTKLLYKGSVNNRLNKVYRYASRPFTFDDIDEKWLSGFVKHCQTKEVNRTKDKGAGNSKNTVNHTIRLLKTIANFAGKANAALNRFKVVYDKNIRAKLTEAELKRFIDYQIQSGTPKANAKNIFLLQYYARGMRIGDALRLKKSDFNNGFLYYSSRKSNKIHKIKVVKKLQEIIDQYPGRDGYLFPFIKGQNHSDEDLNTQVKYRTKDVNRLLKEILIDLKIDKAISTHIARHTFASIADKKLGGDLKDLQAMLGHSSRAMTEVYIRDLRKFDEMDDLADKLFD